MSYTSGQSGKPVGLLYPHDAMRGYVATSRWALDLKDDDILWTQSRPGWLINVVYNAFAPWLCGVENFVTGRIDSAEEIYHHIEENHISVFYTTPAIYRMLLEAGENTARKYNLQNLRHLVSVLGPLFPSVIYGIMRILEFRFMIPGGQPKPE